MYLVESPEDVLTLNVKNEARLSFMTQTTLSVDDTSDVIDALRQRFPKSSGRVKMISATQPLTARKQCVRWLSRRRGAGVGSKNSSNSNRLAELAQRMGKAAFLIDDATDIQEAWVKNAACVGVTAGASAPDILVQNVITRLQELGGVKPFRWKAAKKTSSSKSRKSCVLMHAKWNNPSSEERPAPPVLAFFLSATLS
ncbi:4-hydroxy-3-methylbut-2-enyl diphosphate reductase [Enterobacter cloacae]|uniref:4-hydroxy-3-methylbut-2-enyl diphosphate reductase n=1 Tax=Enterobacter cloacae TaxID=550 RepID=A0A377M6B6_ENTCL|nr:4-hydroxy-3-methylbut-2-enyl diphosphate reductase [Enterobacter cloacae]